MPTPGSPATDDSAHFAEQHAAWQSATPPQRRQRIVETALELLQEQGLPAVTMRAVAQRLGVGTMTLYTYVEGQHGLHREMVRRGFEMLNDCCEKHEGRHTPEDWLRGARRYLDFALEHPNLYKLMFDHPMDAADSEVLRGGFQPYLERVTAYLRERGQTGPDELPHEARRRAGRLWVALHGLAMLALAGRLGVLESDVDEVLADLLPRVGIYAESNDGG